MDTDKKAREVTKMDKPFSRASSIPGRLYERLALGRHGSEEYDAFISRLNELCIEGPRDGKTVLALPFSPGGGARYDLCRAIRITEAELPS